MAVAPRGRPGRWLRRYAPSELLALLGAAAGYLLVHAATDDALAAAYGAAVGDNLAYYGLLIARDLATRSDGVRAGHTLRALAVEFGPAEVLDTAVIRPACTALATASLGPVAGVIAAKLVADMVFYLPVIATYELKTRRPG